MSSIELDPGSFRDPGGQVYSYQGRIFRAVRPHGAASFAKSRSSGVLSRLASRGLLLPWAEVPLAAVPSPGGTVYLLEHPRIPFITYPYEWSFSLHRAAALHHIDVHLAALDEGFTLSDSSAYNIQFQGTRPIFIDHLSLHPYKEGMIWEGHRQFCNQFLNPLIMWSWLGISPNSWFRGSLEGISAEDLSPLLSLKHMLSWTVLTHVVGQAALNRREISRRSSHARHRPSLSKNAMLGMLTGLRRFIESLSSPKRKTVWEDYSGNTSYSAAEMSTKRELVEQMVKEIRPSLLFDIGCNTGDYSEAALAAGAGNVVGFDIDHGSLERAYNHFNEQRLSCLPILLDSANPSPAQGWAQRERMGLSERGPADAMIALAVVHHLAIGRNIPLPKVVEWLMGLAPEGVIEFPPKSDPMVQQLLANRLDVFADYDEETFVGSIRARGQIKSAVRLEGTGRLLVWYRRTA